MAAYIYIYIYYFDLPRAVEVIIEGNQIFPAPFPPPPKIKKNSHNNLIQLPFPFFGGCEKKVGDKLNRLPFFFFPMGGGGALASLLVEEHSSLIYPKCGVGVGIFKF